MIRKLKKFVNLPYTDKKILLHAFWTLIVIKVSLKIMPFQKVWQHYNKQVDPRFQETSDELMVEKIAQAVDRVADNLPNTLCLPRALAVHKLLFERGYHSELKIGTTRDTNGAFIAHAWIEKDNKIIIGYLDNLPTFSAF